MTDKRHTKYPKSLANAETSPKNIQQKTAAFIEEPTKRQLKLAELDKASFELGGIFPYVFDAINYVCTHHKDVIERQPDDKETHYRVRIPYSYFLDFALDGYNEYNKKRLLQELYKIVKAPLTKLVPLDAEHSILTQLVRVDIVYEDGSRYSRYKNLKNTRGKDIKQIALEFYKPLWKKLLNSPHGEAWFLAPKAFYAKMIHAIMEYKDLPEFTRYGQLAYAIDFRRLFLFLNMHDNKQGDHINYDAIELTRKCLPRNIKHDRNGNPYVHNWYLTHQFVQKGLKLINKMAIDNRIPQNLLIPESVFYYKSEKTLKVRFNRNTPQIQDFSGYELPEKRKV